LLPSRTNIGGRFEAENALVTDSPAFERFQFRPAYATEVNPEFPGNGDWGVPVFGFGRDGQVSETFESRWGAPLLVRVTRDSSEKWIGMFAAGGVAGVTGVFACPSHMDFTLGERLGNPWN
jgi:hypothetical protein